MERISAHQFVMLGAAVLMGTTFFPVAQVALGVGGRDGWMAVLPAYGLALPLGLMILALAREYPGQNLIKISETVLGKWTAKGIGLVYLIVSIYFGALLLAQVEDTFKRSVLQLTPHVVFIGAMLFLVGALAWTGIEVFGRFAEVVFPLIILGLIANMVLTLPRFEWEEFFPVFGEGIKPILFAVLKLAPYACEYALFVAGVIAYLPQGGQDQTQLRTGVWRAVIIVGTVNALLTLTELLVFGPAEAKRLNYGLLSLGKLVEIEKTISGVESLFLLIWMGGMIIKVGAFYFMSMWGLQAVFGVQDHLKSYLLLAGVFFVIGLFFQNGVELVQEISVTDDYLILPLAILWIPLVWGIGRWRRRGKAG